MGRLAARMPHDMPGTYVIRVQGELDPGWLDWFGGVDLQTAEGATILTARVFDQAALYGLLIRMRDLGLPLLSVQLIDE